jgi:hypothetical protein
MVPCPLIAVAGRLFSDCGYNGAIFVPVGMFAWAHDAGIAGDSLSSVSLWAGFEGGFYQHPELSGGAVFLRGDHDLCNGSGWNDVISSFNIVRFA